MQIVINTCWSERETKLGKKTKTRERECSVMFCKCVVSMVTQPENMYKFNHPLLWRHRVPLTAPDCKCLLFMLLSVTFSPCGAPLCQEVVSLFRTFEASGGRTGTFSLVVSDVRFSDARCVCRWCIGRLGKGMGAMRRRCFTAWRE